MITHVGIVGSEEKYWTFDQKILARAKISEILDSYEIPILVSGRCHKGGIDVWAEEEAINRKLRTQIYVPQSLTWNSINTLTGTVIEGFKGRNIKIATKSDVLYCIEPEYHKDLSSYSTNIMYDWSTAKFHRRSGGIWTMHHAEGLKKTTHLVIIPI